MCYRAAMKIASLTSLLAVTALALSACPQDTPSPADAAGTPDAVDTATSDGGSDVAADITPTPDTSPDVAPSDVGPDAVPDADASTADGVADADGSSTADAEPDGTADAGTDVDGGPSPIDIPSSPFCENLNPLYCALPLPTDRWLSEDATKPTGFRLDFPPEAIPQNLAADPFDVTPFQRLDGFSPSSSVVTLFNEPVDTTGLAFHDSIPLSLEASHATKIVDLETGELVAHWVENDARAESPAETLFYMRPAKRLLPNRSYGVAISGAVGLDSGQPLEPSAAFAALRDGVLTTSTELEARRAGFEDLFDDLAAAGIPRDSLQAAWRFHTASDETIRARMLAMREDALVQMGADGLGCTVTSVDDDFKSTGARRVRGTFTVPWYLTAPQPPATIVTDANGDPVFQGTEEVDFIAIIPPSLLAATEPGRLITFGHGLFGSAENTLSNAADIAEAAGAVLVATDWHGMSSKDLVFLGTALANTSDFYMLGQNLQQGMISMMTLTRSMMGSCKSLPEMQATAGNDTIDPTQSYFIGGSQGSILGTTALTLSPDIDRGVLIVGGANFSFMIERSIHFNTFELLLAPSYGSRLATGTLMVLSQSVWDDAETAAYIEATTAGLPDIGPKSFLYLVAKNDAQVTNLSSAMAIRSAGVPVMTGSVHLPWDVPVVDSPYTGSAYIAFDVGDPDPPLGNLSPAEDFGGHGAVGTTPESFQMIDEFLGTGVINVPCAPDCTLTLP